MVAGREIGNTSGIFTKVALDGHVFELLKVHNTDE